MENKLRIIHATDGTFAICDYTQVNSRVGIWSPISPKRYATELQAKIALAHIRVGMPEPATAPAVPEPRKVEPSKPTRNRDDFRIVKLDKGFFAVEQRNGAKWVTVAEKKTTAKAESFIIKKLNNGN